MSYDLIKIVRRWWWWWWMNRGEPGGEVFFFFYCRDNDDDVVVVVNVRPATNKSRRRARSTNDFVLANSRVRTLRNKKKNAILFRRTVKINKRKKFWFTMEFSRQKHPSSLREHAKFREQAYTDRMNRAAPTYGKLPGPPPRFLLPLCQYAHPALYCPIVCP